METKHFDHITNDDIIQSARTLRNADNARQHVRPWNRRHRIAWYIAIPAACVVGFCLGFSLRPSGVPTSDGVAPDAPTAIASTPVTPETLIVREVVHDTIFQTRIITPSSPRQPIAKTTTPLPKNSEDTDDETLGVSILHDGIRYDLLASGR